MSHGARRCGKVGDIAGKWKLREVGRDRATCARIEVSRLVELRVEEIARRVEIEALQLAELRVASRMPRTWSKTLESLANPLESLRVRLQDACGLSPKGPVI